jgi:hypothetical protein
VTLINSQAAGSGRPPALVNDSQEVATVPLEKYEVTLPGGRKTVMKLNEADAGKYNAVPLGGGSRSAPAADSEENAPEPKPAAKKRTTSNKARTTANKDGGAGGGDD